MMYSQMSDGGSNGGRPEKVGMWKDHATADR